MTDAHLADALSKIAEAAEANAQLVALCKRQDEHEHDLLGQIRADHEAGRLDTLELYKVYMAYREITRSSYPASWTSVGLPHPNTLHAARRREQHEVARSEDLRV